MGHHSHPMCPVLPLGRYIKLQKRYNYLIISAAISRWKRLYGKEGLRRTIMQPNHLSGYAGSLALGVLLLHKFL
jgi:hypothetical protein